MRYVAFLRGMNLGRRRIKNDELCAAFQAMGMKDATAFLASGNVVFTSAARSAKRLRETIERGLESELNYPVSTFVRTGDEVTALAQAAPFSAKQLAGTTSNIQCLLLAEPPSSSSMKSVEALSTPNDRLAFGDRALYWLPKDKVSESALKFPAIERLVGAGTMRTQRTFIRLAAKHLP